MKLELSDGKIIQNPEKKELDEIIGKIGRDFDFCILSEGDTFIQTAASDSGLIVQYSKADEMFESVKSDLGKSVVCSIFGQFLDHRNGWESAVEFSAMETGSTGVDSGSGSDSAEGIKTGASDGSQTPQDEKSFAEQLKDSVKKEAMNSVNRAAKKITRGVFRKFF